MTVITGLRGLSIDANNTDRFVKDADTLQAPASTNKMMTAYTARQWVSDGMLGNTATVISSDLVGGSTANLQNNDVLTFNDLFYGMMLPSGNDAATCVARNVGQMILDSESGSGDPIVRFLTEMGANAVAFGWSGCVYDDATGLSGNNRMSVRQLISLLCDIGANDSWLRDVMGTYTHAITIVGGPHQRSYSVTHTIDPTGPVQLPEFVAGKTGTTSEAGACVVIIWDHPDGSRHATGILNSTTDRRFPDLRAVMDGVIAESLPGTWVMRNGNRVGVSVGIVRDGIFVPTPFV